MKIGLTYTGSDIKHNNYFNWITGNDDITIVKLSEDLNNLNDVVTCDGILLSGGVDITPSVYGGNEIYVNSPPAFYLKRDEFELSILKLTQENNIPLLGVCRGMQLINCFYGGTLVQDLAEKNTMHKITEMSDKQHDIQIQPGTILSSVITNESATVNSAHHQAIDRVGKGLQITATSDDGIAEALERTDNNNKPFMLAVQWHPERMYQLNLQHTMPAKALRTRFLSEINKHTNGRN